MTGKRCFGDRNAAQLAERAAASSLQPSAKSLNLRAASSRRAACVRDAESGFPPLRAPVWTRLRELGASCFPRRHACPSYHFNTTGSNNEHALPACSPPFTPLPTPHVPALCARAHPIGKLHRQQQSLQSLQSLRRLLIYIFI